MDTTTSVDAQAAPSEQTTAQAALNTSSDALVADGKENISLEDARKLRSEAANLRKRLKSYEDAENQAKEAQMSEIERTSKQFTELQATHNAYVQAMQTRIVRYEVQIQASKLGIIDPDAAARLIDSSELDFDDNGIPTNAEDLLKKLLKNKPYLASKTETPAASTGNRTPMLPAMNPGRTAITSPGTKPQPGKIPSWSDVLGRP